MLNFSKFLTKKQNFSAICEKRNHFRENGNVSKIFVKMKMFGRFSRKYNVTKFRQIIRNSYFPNSGNKNVRFFQP
jgi:hypothetical protein